MSNIDPEDKDSWENLIGEPADSIEKKEPDEHCNARKGYYEDDDVEKDNRLFAGFCQCIAGQGTQHYGSGRCRMHGGSTPRGVDSPHFKHGIFSDYLTDEDQLAIDGISEYENADKLQEIIDWRISKLRRMLRAKQENSDVSTDFWDAYRELVRATDTIGADEIKELASIANSEDRAVRAEIDQIRKLIKDHNTITEGDTINLSPSEQWKVGLMNAQQDNDNSKGEDDSDMDDLE